jgi:hypothetical protein
MSTQQKEINILDPVSSKLDKKSSKKSCKCSQCRKKHKQYTHVCCKCGTIKNADYLTNDPDCVKVKRDSQNIFITFLS